MSDPTHQILTSLRDALKRARTTLLAVIPPDEYAASLDRLTYELNELAADVADILQSDTRAPPEEPLRHEIQRLLEDGRTIVRIRATYANQQLAAFRGYPVRGGYDENGQIKTGLPPRTLGAA